MQRDGGSGGGIRRLATLACLSTAFMGTSGALRVSADDAVPSWELFVVAAGEDDRAARAALEQIRAGWRDGYAPIFIDLARLLPGARRAAAPEDLPADLTADERDSAPLPGGAPQSGFPSAAPAQPGSEGRRRILSFLEKQTGQRLGDDLRAWRRWMWSRREALHPDYAVFKGELYGRIDPAFREFFPPGVRAAIRLDEIDWGGVRVNGIPPLRQPKNVPAAEATWLKDDHVVFGLEVGGESRAYPKRILAWHELATDRLAGRDLTIVYCTLCGTVVPYESRAGGRHFTFGTSGLLYRSNKLMFDEETHTLWSAIDGTPAVGLLVGSGLRLSVLPVVTTTWGEWRREHPTTTVLSLQTGFERDYREGAAYRDYFATDRLMFEVPVEDKRLRNKAEVLVLRSEILGQDAPPVAIAIDRLRREPVFSFDAAGRRFVVVTSKEGANRVYDAAGFTFAVGDETGRVRDSGGRTWTATPEALVRESGERLDRVPAHRAFWFGWHAQHPDTVLHR